MKCVLLVIFVCVGRIHCTTRVPFITPCRAADRECLKSSAQAALPVIAAGVPSLGVHTLDPMEVEHVSADEAGLKMDFKNTVVRGLRHCRVLDVERDGPQMSVRLQCSVVLVGRYKLSGHLLLFPISGEGRYKITIRDIVVKVTLQTEERQVGSQRYWHVLSWTHTADVITSVVYQFENLFNGDKTLARPVARFANAHWRGIFKEVSPPIVKAIVDKIVHETSQLFERVPISELALH